MVKFRAVLMDLLEGRIDPVVLVRTDIEVQDKRLSVVSALNFFEEVSIAVLRRTANEDRLRDFFSAIVVQAFAKLDRWIEIERKIDNEPSYYTNFETLATRWRKK
jgi:hypothetical protein